MIIIRQLKKIYRLSGREVHALRGVDLSVGDGEFISVTGKSGSGKSTLLNLIAGLDRVSAGSVSIDGTEITKLSDRQMSLFRANHFGIVFQSFNLVPELNAKENVLLGLSLCNGFNKANRDSADVLMEYLGLSELKDHLPGEMSGGEQQRVAIARAMIGDPDILLLDEPTGNLDYETSKEVIKLILKIHRETDRTVILVTHDTEFASYADRIVTLQSGLLIDDGVKK